MSITSNFTAGTTTVVANGKTEIFDHLFSSSDIQLHGKHDHVTFNVIGSPTAANHATQSY